MPTRRSRAPPDEIFEQVHLAQPFWRLLCSRPRATTMDVEEESSQEFADEDASYERVSESAKSAPARLETARRARLLAARTGRPGARRRAPAAAGARRVRA